MSTRKSPWVAHRPERPNAKLRLFCFPYAGASGVLYRKWAAAMPADVDVCAIEPPGHFARPKEPRIETMSAFVDALDTELRDWLDRPFALLGYSLGALVAFEWARTMRMRRSQSPAQLIVMARGAPSVPIRVPAIAHLPSLAFVKAIEARFGVLDPMVKADAELVDAVAAIMRSDLKILESYRYEQQPRLACPIVAIGSTEDPTVSESALEGWRSETSGSFSRRIYRGGHFFIREHTDALIAEVRDRLVSHSESIQAQYA